MIKESKYERLPDITHIPLKKTTPHFCGVIHVFLSCSAWMNISLANNARLCITLLHDSSPPFHAVK
jgi:hypothetical protein